MNTLILEACKQSYEAHGDFEAKGTPRNIGLWFAYEDHIKNINSRNFYFNVDLCPYESWFDEERCEILREKAIQIRDNILNPTIFKYYRDHKVIKMGLNSWFILEIGGVLHVDHIAVCLAMAQNRCLTRLQEPVNYDWYSEWLSHEYGDVNDAISLLTKLIKDAHLSLEDIIIQIYLKKQ